MTIRRVDAPDGISVTGLIGRPYRLGESEIREMADSALPAPDGTVAVAVASVLTGVEIAAVASHVSVVSDDGLYSASIPLDQLLEKGLLIVGGDATLTRDEGGPFRLTVPDGRTLCWNVKSVGELRVTDHAEPDNVPENPTH